MSKRDYHTAYELERLLSQSIDKMSDNITKQRNMREQIKRLRRQRKQIESVPDEVKRWFEETADMDEEEEESL